jgi:3-phosphoshikimate 1-carboxyvinyltransferase
VDVQVEGGTVRIKGTGGKFSVKPGQERIFVGNSGSTIRMMASLAALAPARVIFEGDSRLHERPVGDLLSALKSLGIQAKSIGGNDCPPIEIPGGRLPGGEVAVSGKTSSQHISSLLMVAPYAEKDMKIRITDSLHSKPYVAITIDAMRQFGVDVENRNYEEFIVKSGQKYQGRHYKVEGDYSSAAYFFAVAAIGKSSITVANLNPVSAQGDKHFLDILSDMGCIVTYGKNQVKVSRKKDLTGVTVDMGDYPDIVQPLAIVAAFAKGKTKIINIAHLRYKETDRIDNTAAELRKMGIKVDVTSDTMSITSGKPKGASIETYNDHRMAMSFAIAALFADGETIINGAESVAKSYPGFFTDLAKIGAQIEAINKTSIVLIGMRGSGKTTVGRLLAQKLGKRFIEMDEMIVQRMGLSIPEIVQKYGWGKFREVEKELTLETAKLDNVVNATGGGVVTNEENIRALKQKGKLVWLKVGLDTLLQRIGDDPSRPSLTGKPVREDMAAVLAERTPLYQRAADFTIDTDSKSSEEIVESIIKLMNPLRHCQESRCQSDDLVVILEESRYNRDDEESDGVGKKMNYD